MNLNSQKIKFLSVLFTLVSFIVSSQEKTIKGTVKDAFGIPIPGASVLIKNSQFGARTDVDGSYAIKVNDKNAILVFSYLGLKTVEIPVNGKTLIDATLVDDAEKLNEVVVVGYGTQKKKDLTGSVSLIKSDDLKNRTNTQIGNLIQGQATGVQVLNSSGKPGQGLSIRIRGTSSILSGSEPLYVVDGVPTTDTRSINPADVESITVLKDAASAAIYGASGANGVVLLTTKKGTSSKPRITYETYTGFSQAWKTLPVLNGEQYRDLVEELGLTTDWNRYNQNTDWQNKIFQTGTSSSHQLSIAGKSNDTNYYISAGYLSQDGAVRSSEMKRLNYKVNLDQKINSWLSAGTRIAYTKYSDVDIKDNTSVNSGGVLLGSLTTPSVIGVYNADGSFTNNPFQNWENPYASTDGLDRGYKSTRFLANLFLQAKLSKDFTFKTNYGIDNSSGVYESFLDPFRTGYGKALKGQAIRNSDQTDYFIFDNTLTYA
jgi:TonB-linked SusC/RagA family outer membrane protein